MCVGLAVDLQTRKRNLTTGVAPTKVNQNSTHAKQTPSLRLTPLPSKPPVTHDTPKPDTPTPGTATPTPVTPTPTVTGNTNQPTLGPTDSKAPTPDQGNVPVFRRNLTIVAEPEKVQPGGSVTFHLEPQDQVYDYEFDFGDKKKKQTKSAAETTIQHSFDSAGSYTVNATAKAPPSVRPFRGRILSAVITVQHVNTPTPDGNAVDGRDWILYVILVVVALLLIAGIYKLTKSAFAPKPSFVSQMDVGGATMDHGNDASLINSELYLNPNIREGLFEIIHGETGLIHAERSQP
jgi:hypothetical protein